MSLWAFHWSAPHSPFWESCEKQRHLSCPEWVRISQPWDPKQGPGWWWAPTGHSINHICSYQEIIRSYHKKCISSVQSLSRVRLFVTPWIAALQASPTITNSQSLLKLMSIKLVMPSNHLILCRSLFLLPSIFCSIRVFSNESLLLIRWAKYWSFSFIISPSNEYSGLISFTMDWLDLHAVQGTLKNLLQHHSS